MRKFFTGFAAGLLFGAASAAAAAQMVGSSGYLRGWTVTKDGDEICYMPYVWASIREIEC